MKKYYLSFIILFVWSGLSLRAQVTLLSKQRAEKIASQRNYNAEETERFVERAISGGVNLNPLPYSSYLKPPASVHATGNNLDFELQNFTGWNGNWTTNNCSHPTPNIRNTAGIHYTTPNTNTDSHGIVTTGSVIVTPNDTIPCVCPWGGLASCRLGDMYANCGAADLSQTFQVTYPDTSIDISYAVVLSNAHLQPDRPMFYYTLKTSTGGIIDSLLLVDSSMTNFFCHWTKRTISLSAFVGTNVTLDFLISDCNGGGHTAYAFVDVQYTGAISGIASAKLDATELYPNPAALTLFITGFSGENVIITDLLGNVVQSAPARQANIAIDVTNIPNGLYLAILRDKERFKVRKFVVKH